MSASLRALLLGSIDYAGLFPPARLPLEHAIHNYAGYRPGAEAWMLGRFICPAARLLELSPFVAKLFAAGPPLGVLGVAALGRGGSERAEFLANLHADMQAIADFRTRHEGSVAVDVFEVRLPTDILPPQEPKVRNTLLADAAGVLQAFGPPGLTPYYEIGMGPDWGTSAPAVIAALGLLNGSASGRSVARHRPAGFKLRCGGLEASAFPTPQQVALAVAVCRDHAVPLKATAGLHHPIRRFDSSVQAQMHGFINLFAAGVLAHARHLSAAVLQQIISDEESSSFAFDDKGLRWREHRATTTEVVAARLHAVISFGSCSFDEPRADLRALGWLPEVK